MGIKSDAFSKVKTVFIFSCIGLALSFLHLRLVKSDEFENLPQIEAKDYSVTTIRKTKSNRVYLLKKDSGELPEPGRILLLRENEQPAMALRVLRIYPDRGEIAAKRIKTYLGRGALPESQSFQAVEKIADIVPAQTPEDRADLKEIESPPPQNEDVREEAKVIEDPTPEDLKDIIIEEVHPVDQTPHALSGEFGYFRNNSPNELTSYYAGGGLRYSYTPSYMIFLQKNALYDSLAFEFGVFLYTVQNFVEEADSYTVFPFIGTLRYNLHFGEAFGIFGYSGIMYNLALPSAEEFETGASTLSTFSPAVGAGAFFQLGPNWEARAQLGLDMIGAGLVLRF